jgi:hypothetical protein
MADSVEIPHYPSVYRIPYRVESIENGVKSHALLHPMHRFVPLNFVWTAKKSRPRDRAFCGQKCGPFYHDLYLSRRTPPVAI